MYRRIYRWMHPRKFLALSCLQIALSLGVIGGSALSQQVPPPDAPQPQNQGQQATQSNSEPSSERNKISKNHIFWVIPNYRADESQAEFTPLTRGAKFKVAVDAVDSFGLASPKSISLAPAFVSMMFAGLRSRWIMPC